MCIRDRDESGNPEAAITVYQDITERLKAERELQQYRSRLEDLVDERTQEPVSYTHLDVYKRQA